MRTTRKLGLLATLYFSQGLPFGFFVQALPVLLRKQGVSLAAIGSTSLLSLPWMLKFLWAPSVDRHGSARFGARRVWILPLQAASVLLMLALSFVDPGHELMLVYAGVLCANLFAATQDIATDALAIDLLSERERGFGNGVQVAGYRVGMIVGGGLLLVVFEQLGFRGSFWVMAGLLLLASVPVWFYREPARTAPALPPSALGLGAVWKALASPTVRSFLPVLLTYKSADAFGTAMLRPYLVDRGMTLGSIGWLLGTVGFAAGLTGALAGGTLAARFPRRTLLALFAVVHAAGLGLYALLASGAGGSTLLTAAIVLEHFAGGMATAALFTVMMDHTTPETAATDYTVQACLVLLAGGLFGLPSGWVAEFLGYAGHFALAGLFGLGAALVALVVLPRGRPGALAQ